jgi:hypothetical protein
VSYALRGLGLSVYYPPGTPQNPTPPEPTAPPPAAPPPAAPPVPMTTVADTGWWGAQSPAVRYSILGVGALLVVGAVIGVAKK